VAYESLLKRQSRNLHAQVGNSMETLYAEALGEHVELLAYHFRQAQTWDKAWRYQLDAGKRAITRFANQEAITFFVSALEIAEHLPHLETFDLANAHSLLAKVLSGINQYDEALAELEQGLELTSAVKASELKDVTVAQIYQKMGQVLRSIGEYPRAIEAIQQGIDALTGGFPKERGALKIAMASTLVRQGEFEAAQQWCEEGLEDVDLGGDLAELAHTYSLLGTIRSGLGDIAASLEWRQKSLAISEEIDSIPLQMEAHNNLAVANYFLGRLEKAVVHYEKSRELSQQIGNLNTAARAEINLGEVHLLRGDLAEAERSFRSGLSIWEGTGYQLGQAYGAINMGAVLTRQSKPREALEFLETSENILAELGARSYSPIVHRHQASSYLALEDLETAEEFALRSLTIARELSMVRDEGAALRVLGEIFRAKGSLTQSVEYLEQSLVIFREAEIQYEEARVLFELARVWGVDGKADLIREALSTAAEIFTSLGAKHDLQKTEELLESLVR
jgi:tetratricopeptide (TPR) repeat protein